MSHRYLAAGVLAAGLMLPLAVSAQDEPPIAFVIDAPFYVTWASANVRTAPDATSDLLATLPFGTQVTVTGEVAGGDWFRVALPDGQVGYVWLEVLAPMIIGGPDVPATGPDDGTDAADAIPVTDDNDFVSATPITEFPATVGGGVGEADASDVWSFDVEAWTRVQITMTGLSSDIDIALIDPDGNYLAESLAGGSSDEFMEAVVGPGEYFIEVYVFEGNSFYDLVVETFPADPPPPDIAGDTLETAFDLGALDGRLEVSDFVGLADDGDMFRFRVPTDASVAVRLSGLESDVDVELLDDFGSVLGSSAAGGSDPELIEADLAAGTFYVFVYPFSGASAFTLSVETVGGTDTAETQADQGAGPDDTAGNTAEAAMPIALAGADPVTVTEFVGPDDSDDYFRITPSGPGPVTITLQPFETDLDLEVYDAANTYLSGSFNFETEADSVTIEGDGGDLIVRVYAFGTPSGYELTVTEGQ